MPITSLSRLALAVLLGAGAGLALADGGSSSGGAPKPATTVKQAAPVKQTKVAPVVNKTGTAPKTGGGAAATHGMEGGE